MTENGVAQVPPDEDRTPTQEEAPPVKPPDGWVMPEPVFRQTDGYTPNAPRPDPVENTATAERDLHVSEDASANPAAPIAEQPDLADIVTDPAVDLAPPKAKKKGGFFRVLLIILGIGAIALVAAAIAIALVSWYFFQVSESQNLN